MSQVKSYIEFAERLADSAAQVILPHYRQNLTAEDKGGSLALFDPVTIADRDAEHAMRLLIESQFPDHGIIGEEFGNLRENADYVWVLDPIDGTKSFICGMPSWGTLIGLLHKGEPVLGLVDQPFLQERFIGEGNNAYAMIKGERFPLKTRHCHDLANAHVYIGGSMSINPLLPELIATLKDKVQLLRIGGDAYTFAMLAKGHIDIIIDAGLELYDIAAHIPLIAAAGGKTGDWQGNNAIGSTFFQACGDLRLADQLTNLIGKLKP